MSFKDKLKSLVSKSKILDAVTGNVEQAKLNAVTAAEADGHVWAELQTFEQTRYIKQELQKLSHAQLNGEPTTVAEAMAAEGETVNTKDVVIMVPADDRDNLVLLARYKADRNKFKTDRVPSFLHNPNSSVNVIYRQLVNEVQRKAGFVPTGKQVLAMLSSEGHEENGYLFGGETLNGDYRLTVSKKEELN